MGAAYVRYRYDRSFEAKLIQSDETVKRYYSELKNELLSYRKVSSRMSWRHEAFRRGRPVAAKFVIRGKTLCLCLALDPKVYEDSKYIVDDMSEYSKFAATPLLYRIKNERRLKYAKELIAVLFAEGEKMETESVDYAAIPYEKTQPLVNRGLIRVIGSEAVSYDANTFRGAEIFDDEDELEGLDGDGTAEEGDERTSVMATEVDRLMSDEEAERAFEKGVRYADKTKTGIINVDTLSKFFSDGEKITLEEIKKRVPNFNRKITYVKVLARGELDKKFIVEADDFSIEAVKMILLMHGRVIKTASPNKVAVKRLGNTAGKPPGRV